MATTACRQIDRRLSFNRPEIIDAVIDFYLAGGYDYAANSVQPTFPDGWTWKFSAFPFLNRHGKKRLCPLSESMSPPSFTNSQNDSESRHYQNAEDLLAPALDRR